MDADPGASVRTHEGLVAGARRRGRPRRPGLGHGLRRATPAPPWPARCCGWGGSRACTARPSPPRSRCPGADPHGAARRRRQRRVRGRVAGAVRPDGGRLRPRALRHRPAPGGPAVHRRGADQGQRRWSRRPTSSSPRDRGSATRGGAVRRQRRGPRPHERRRRRRRHRRLHRQRGAQDPRGRPARPSIAGAPRGLRLLRRGPGRRRHAAGRRSLPLYDSLDPENTGGAMLLGLDGVCIISHGSSSATAIVNAVQRGPGHGAGRRRRTSRPHRARRVAPAGRLGRKRSQAHERWITVRSPDRDRTRRTISCPQRPTSNSPR